jgi:CHASE2 domain-containing sensor protein
MSIRLSPYKGLMPYDEGDAEFFFGREREIKLISANLLASRLTLLYGESGIGKTSVLSAGVMHYLRQRAQEDLVERGASDFIAVMFNSWADEPIKELKRSILDSIPPHFDKGKIERLGLTDSLSQFLMECTTSLQVKLLVILDQFEEYFVYNVKEVGGSNFSSEFPSAINRLDLGVNFLISIREDSLSKLDHFKGRIVNLFDNYLRLNPLDFEAGRTAIEKPVERYNQLYLTNSENVAVEPALVQAVLEEVKTGGVVIGGIGRGLIASEIKQAQIETPYLQLVMTRLWREEIDNGKRCLRLDTLKKLGGAKTIIRTHLDSSMQSLSLRERDVAASIFHYLVTPSGTKVAHTIRDLAEYSKLSETDLSSVIEKLSHGTVRILRTLGPSAGNYDDRRYEIYHDALAATILDWRSRHIIDKQKSEAQGQLIHEKRNRLRYWLSIAAIISIGIVVGNWLAKQPQWVDRRDKILQSLNPRQMYPRNTVLVMIGDEEYWKGELAGRVPIKRDYLAKLIEAVGSANPAVIGVDFNLQSPTPEGSPVEFPQYQSETNRLLETVRIVSSHGSAIVLPMSLGIDGLAYVKESDIYDNFDFGGANVHTGYIALPDDTRQIPISDLKLRNGQTAYSFSTAMVRAFHPEVLRKIGETEAPHYASFLKPEAFDVISASAVLNSTTPSEELMRKMRSKLVIIGGNWHSLGYERGTQVAAYQTPVGNIPGAFIHANYAEAILDGRVYTVLQGNTLTLVQVLLGLGVAIILRLNLRFFIKFAAVFLLYVALVVFNYFSFISLEVFLPVILIIAYFSFEQIRQWREWSRARQHAV